MCKEECDEDHGGKCCGTRCRMLLNFVVAIISTAKFNRIGDIVEIVRVGKSAYLNEI